MSRFSLRDVLGLVLAALAVVVAAAILTGIGLWLDIPNSTSRSLSHGLKNIDGEMQRRDREMEELEGEAPSEPRR